MRFVFAITTALALVPAGAASGAPDSIDSHDLSGTWTLNAWLTDPGDQIEHELTADLGPRNQYDAGGDERTEQPRPPTRGAMGRGGMDRPRTTMGSAPAKALLSADDNRRIQSLIDAVRQPAVTLTIAQDSRGITIADLRGSRTFLIGGSKQEPLDTGTITASTHWEGPQLPTDYDVRRGVTLRFSYMLVPEGDHLLVRISVLTPGDGPAPYVIRHVYSRATKG